MEPGAVAAVVQSGGETVWQVSLPPTGRPSDSVAQLKREAMAWMTSYLQAKQMDTDEVDLMEQAISDDEGAGSGKGSGKGKGQQQQGKGGRKRKQQQSPAAAAAAGGT